MKKTLAALAVLGAFAGSAMAADVTLYGALDTGFEYKHTKSTGERLLISSTCRLVGIRATAGA